MKTQTNYKSDTVKALNELEKREGKSFENTDELFEDLDN